MCLLFKQIDLHHVHCSAVRRREDAAPNKGSQIELCRTTALGSATVPARSQ